MKKKILSLILVAAMLASMLVFAPVSGATTDTKATVDVTETAGVAGSTVSVDVVVTMNAIDDGANPIVTFIGLVEYDRTRLTVESAMRTDAWNQDPNSDARNDDNTDLKPYADDGWITLAAWNCPDATEGVVAFTLTFTINGDAPAGDAYVKFHHVGSSSDRICMVNYDSNKDNYLDDADEITYLDGKVTVLPKGYNADISTEGMTFTNNGDSTATLANYTGDATELIIPETWYDEATGETLTVTKVGPMVFCSIINTTTYELSKSNQVKNNDTITKIVVPATVTEIADYAFMNGNAVTEIVVLGTPTIGVCALGCTGGVWKASGTVQNRKYLWDGAPGYENEGSGNVFIPYDYNEETEEITIHLTLVGTTATVFDDYNQPWIDGYYGVRIPERTIPATSGNLTVNVGEATDTYFVYGVDAIVAPEMAGVVAWTDAEGNVYAPGAGLGDATEITAVVVDAPVSDADVTAKITDEFAMRFQATVSKATYDAMAALGKVQMGMLITPRQYVVQARNVFTKEALDALVAGTEYKGYVDIPVQNPISANAATFEECTEFTIAGSLAGLKKSTAQKNPDFVAIGYLQVALASGDVVTVYGEYNYLAANNVGDFLDGVKTEGLGDLELAWISAWKDLFNN